MEKKQTRADCSCVDDSNGENDQSENKKSNFDSHLRRHVTRSHQPVAVDWTRGDATQCTKY